jgi:hypothetical protein
VSLYSYTVETITAKAPARCTVQEKIPLGGAVRLELVG